MGFLFCNFININSYQQFPAMNSLLNAADSGGKIEQNAAGYKVEKKDQQISQTEFNKKFSSASTWRDDFMKEYNNMPDSPKKESLAGFLKEYMRDNPLLLASDKELVSFYVKAFAAPTKNEAAEKLIDQTIENDPQNAGQLMFKTSSEDNIGTQKKEELNKLLLRPIPPGKVLLVTTSNIDNSDALTKTETSTSSGRTQSPGGRDNSSVADSYTVIRYAYVDASLVHASSKREINYTIGVTAPNLFNAVSDLYTEYKGMNIDLQKTSTRASTADMQIKSKNDEISRAYSINFDEGKSEVSKESTEIQNLYSDIQKTPKGRSLTVSLSAHASETGHDIQGKNQAISATRARNTLLTFFSVANVGSVYFNDQMLSPQSLMGLDLVNLPQPVKFAVEIEGKAVFFEINIIGDEAANFKDGISSGQERRVDIAYSVNFEDKPEVAAKRRSFTIIPATNGDEIIVKKLGNELFRYPVGSDPVKIIEDRKDLNFIEKKALLAMCSDLQGRRVTETEYSSAKASSRYSCVAFTAIDYNSKNPKLSKLVGGKADING